MASQLVRVYRSSQTIEAQLVRSALVGAGLEAHLHGEHLTGLGGLGAFPASEVEVRVPADQADEAQAVIDEALRRDEEGRVTLVDPEAEEGRLELLEEDELPDDPSDEEPGRDPSR